MGSRAFDDEAVAGGVRFHREFGAGLPAPGAEGFDGECDRVGSPASEFGKGASVPVFEWSAGHGGDGLAITSIP